MHRMLTLLGGLGVGAGLMYLLDPDKGRYRRSLMRDKAVHALNQWDTSIERKSHDLSNRAFGMLSEARYLVRPDAVEDGILEQRVRAEMGHTILHSHGIEVTADAGRVVLRGTIMADAVPELITRIESVRGVTRVVNLLTALHTPEEAEAQPMPVACLRLAAATTQMTMGPTTRMLTGALGGFFVMKAAKRHDFLGSVLNLAGVGLIGRCVTASTMKGSEKTGGRICCAMPAENAEMPPAAMAR